MLFVETSNISFYYIGLLLFTIILQYAKYAIIKILLKITIPHYL